MVGRVQRDAYAGWGDTEHSTYLPIGHLGVAVTHHPDGLTLFVCEVGLITSGQCISLGYGPATLECTALLKRIAMIECRDRRAGFGVALYGIRTVGLKPFGGASAQQLH
jgi:hypothetical protein